MYMYTSIHGESVSCVKVVASGATARHRGSKFCSGAGMKLGRTHAPYPDIEAETHVYVYVLSVYIYIYMCLYVV